MEIYDQEMGNKAMDNAFLLVTGRATLADLFDLDDPYVFIPFDPDDIPNKEQLIEDLIEHYSHFEEYEKCQELVNLKECQ